ncbi:ATP/GTP-binding protein [Streptomyces spongiicola]|uniref:ATP/GTP-binding protein n=1 Tax=Streptomyces spongiicola TaxID=1690221 RepID=A0A388T419_9ACTN|nr:ATP/GTP-binding protein [Streptomyces spongiicola]
MCGLDKGALGILLDETARRYEPSESVGRPVEGVREPSSLGHLTTLLNGGQDSAQYVGHRTSAATSRQYRLLSSGRDRPRSGDVRPGKMSGALEFLGKPGGKHCRMADFPDRQVCSRAGRRTGRHNVATVSPDVDLPGKGTAPTGPAGALPATIVSCPVPDVEPTGRSPDPQRALVVRRAGNSSQGRQNGDRMESVGETGEVHVLGDGDAGKNAVPIWRLSLMSIDVDDDQPCGATCDTHSEKGVRRPPSVDASLVQGGRVEAMTPAAGVQARTTRGDMAGTPAAVTVRGRGLTTVGEGMHRPAATRAPLSHGQRPTDERGL